MSLAIRVAAEADFESLCRIFQEINACHSQALPQIFRPLEPEQAMHNYRYLLDEIKKENVAIYIAEVDETVVGAIHVSVRQSPDFWAFAPRRYAWIDNLAVSVAYRGRGIGSTLVATAREWATDRDITQLELNVWSFNQDAIRFYERLGFDTACRRMWMTVT